MFFTLFVCLFFENNTLGRRPLWCVVELLPQDIASAFVGRFRCGLQRFFCEEKPFPDYGKVWKIVARWRYGRCPNRQKKIENLRKMGAKFVRTTSTIYKRDERKLLPQHFTSCTVDVHPYKNILPAH